MNRWGRGRICGRAVLSVLSQRPWGILVFFWAWRKIYWYWIDSTTGLRSEFDGSSRDEVSRLVSGPYTSTAQAPCLLLSATLNSANIRLGFSLLSTVNTGAAPLPTPPMVVQTASPNGSAADIQLYYIHLPVGGMPVMLEIKASQFYSGSMQYSAVFLQRIEPNSCKVIQPSKITIFRKSFDRWSMFPVLLPS
jgi:hypothetical protein